jgi:Fur family zinc uptake transcriptional regulator
VVYRALDFLAGHGLVHKLHSRNAFVACSQPDGGHGAQFLICTRCERIAEIADRKVERGVIAAAREAGFTVRRPMIEIEGLCPHCAG